MVFNGLICFTNCLLAQEDGNLVVEKDLWVDETQGLILDAQVRHFTSWIYIIESNFKVFWGFE